MSGAVDLWAEFNAARQAMTPPDRALLGGYGISAGDILFLCGVADIHVDGVLYEPAADGALAYLTPAHIDDPLTPEALCPAEAVRFGELVDLIAWHPRHPGAWALHTGNAEWLGAIEPQYFDPEPVPILRSPLRWLQNGGRGLVPLSRSRPEQYRVLTWCQNGLIGEDEAHAAELRRVLAMPWSAPPVTAAAPRKRQHAA